MLHCMWDLIKCQKRLGLVCQTSVGLYLLAQLSWVLCQPLKPSRSSTSSYWSLLISGEDKLLVWQGSKVSVVEVYFVQPLLDAKLHFQFQSLVFCNWFQHVKKGHFGFGRCERSASQKIYHGWWSRVSTTILQGALPLSCFGLYRGCYWAKCA